ncbi:MAG: UDP-N-acetylmuramoyl-tripeptide--D-alanyl-D-alanine ligase [Candidatus Ordinivivax streblomastigis]|uniref:UDP-N-acetylmuramoyl-tripeptide--D-alanyl-D-alanine ligase n=1 Tax=Candidatus Ordinivivax streblomastigis TaxID=2540710 RepID=A0A5M8P2C6_9BACT|nr:MAG: UDP-N-acetylmuramoyl-tripeptide--D-alanyl-D-alanine ligase [Candidatus Ordinivivax streblomastigis]
MQLPQLYEIFQRYPLISTDSRNCPSNALFFALKGDKFDGNHYIKQVLNSGVAFAVGDCADLPKDERIIQVDNVLQTLQDLANYHRKQMKVQVIAVTGTNGKTTTKELIAKALSSKYVTLFTQGNLNNHIGVPLTLLQLKPEHEFAVVEMGANHQGEIRTLCRIAEPDFGLITNVGRAHLEGFGSFEGVVRAKTELYDFLREKGGIVFGNLDNPFLQDFYPSLSMVYYGANPQAEIHGHITACAPTLALEWDKGNTKHSVTTHLVGSYNFENVLAAICMADYFGVESALINRAIQNYLPGNNRSQNHKTVKNDLILDAYNANPCSMQAALDNFARLDGFPKMVILGEMRELGDYSYEEHQRLIDKLSILPLEQIFLVGENFNNLAVNPKWKVFAHTDALAAYLQTSGLEGYHILIKGSRNNQLEKLIPYL